MTVPWKAWKTKYGFFHASHRPLKIPQNRRDFHIPTAQACTAWKSGKPTTGFPLSHPVHAMTTTVLSLNRKTKRKEVGRYAASSFFMPLSLRSSGTDFMLILQLENARHPPGCCQLPMTREYVASTAASHAPAANGPAP